MEIQYILACFIKIEKEKIMKRVGLFIGIDDYENGIPKLSCASADAYNMSLAFSKAGFSVHILQDKKASYESVIGKIQEIMNTLNPGDLLTFYFAGHGREHDSEHYLIGAGGFSDSNLYALGALPLSALISLTDRIPGLHRFFILDCCRKNLLSDRSGDDNCCGQSRNIALDKAVVQNTNREIIPPLILSSCSTGQKAYENLKTQQGYFTEKFITVIENAQITSFSRLQEELKLPVENQDVDWRGPMSRWANVPLFQRWENHSTAPAGTIISSIPVQNHSSYDVILKKLDVEKLKKQLTGTVPDMVQTLLNLAEQAEKDKEYDSAMKILERVQTSLEDELKNDPEELYTTGKKYYDAGNYDEAVKYFREAAELNHTDAMTFLGICYVEGQGVPQSDKEAVKWYRKAADLNNAAAQYNLGTCYEYGTGVTQSYEEAVKWYRKSAGQDHAPAQNSLGDCYANGYGVPESRKEAVKWYRKAAEQDDAYAQNNLGECYYYGKGVTQSCEEAVKWYRKSAGQDHAPAQNSLGFCYQKGYGVPQSYEEAVKWYRKAAEQNDAKAQNNLGFCYQKGYGVPQSYEEAVKWYRKAAEQNHAAAQNNLGFCYQNGYGVPQSYEEAVKWYRKAAEQNCAEAQYNLGDCYYNGHGVSQSYEEAVKWYRKAAEQNHAAAQNDLGFCYKNGYGVPQSYEEAIKWYRKAAEQNLSSAESNLGYCYENGYGVPKDLAKAKEWYAKAAKNGSKIAKKALERLSQTNTSSSAADTQTVNIQRKTNTSVSQEEQDYSSLCRGVTYWKDGDYKSAFDIFLSIAHHNNACAQYNVALCFYYGNGTPKDKAKAVYWLKRASENGSKEAKEFLGQI